MEEILDILRKVERPGTFATSGTIESCFLDLEIAQVGKVTVPLLPQQIEDIIPYCEQAPYGRGEETVLDTEVRSTWQLDAAHITINNPQWEEILTRTIKDITHDLGLGNSKAQHYLYKLLIYKEGDFFDKHRDTEKVDNMFATLVVVLPSEHEGGELIVQHGGHHEQFDFSNNSRYHIQYAAFYADCQHEVKPVTKGYRCCLVYNLSLIDHKKQPLAPNNLQFINKLSKALNDYFKVPEQDKLAVMLEHQYSKAGLNPNQLKNGDIIKADVMTAAAKKSNCDVYFGIVTRWEMGSLADYFFDEDDLDDLEIEEIHDISLTVEELHTPDNELIEVGLIHLEESQLLDEFDFTSRPPDEQEIEEATGNAGASMERWYSQAALILWPQEDRYGHFVKAGLEYSIPLLHKMVFEQQQPTAACKKFAQKIMETLSDSFNHRMRYYSSFHASPAVMVQLLQAVFALQDEELIHTLLTAVLDKFYTNSLHEEMLKLDVQYGWERFAEDLKQLPNHYTNNDLFPFTELLEKATVDAASMAESKYKLCEALLQNTFTRLQENDEETQKHAQNNQATFRSFGTPDTEANNARIKALVCLTKVTDALQQPAFSSKIISYCFTKPKIYDLRKILIPFLKKLTPLYANTNNDAYQKLYEHCVEKLQDATAQPIPKPTDWKQNVKLTCSCEDCQELQAFISNPDERKHRFKIKKERRQHLHQQIEKHQCDIEHETERKGSPQTLVCTKLRTFYESQEAQWQQDKKILAELRGI